MRWWMLALLLPASCERNFFSMGGSLAGVHCDPTVGCPPGLVCVPGENICRSRCAKPDHCTGSGCECSRDGNDSVCDVDLFCRHACSSACGPTCQGGTLDNSCCPSGQICDPDSQVCRTPCASSSCGVNFSCELASNECPICRPASFPLPDGATIIDGGESFDGGSSSDLAAPATPLVVASGQQMPQFVALDGVTSSLLWDTAKSIMSCPISGCGGGGLAITLANSTAAARGLTVAGNWVVWSDADGNVLACPTVGCSGMTPMIVATGQTGVGPVTSDGTFAYWTAGNALEQCNIQQGCGPSPSPIVTIPGLAASLTLDGNALFWTSGDSILWCLKTSCASPQILTSGLTPTPGPMVTPSTNGIVYFAQGDCIYSCPVGIGCQPLKIACNGGATVRQLAVDNTNLYWTLPSEVKSCPLTNCNNMPKTFAPGQMSPEGITLDNMWVYWANSGDGTIRKLAK